MLLMLHRKQSISVFETYQVGHWRNPPVEQDGMEEKVLTVKTTEVIVVVGKSPGNKLVHKKRLSTTG